MFKTLSSSLQIEKAMQSCIRAAPADFSADGIFFNYYREDIRSIQFVALATKNYCQLKPSVTSIPEEIASTFKVSDNFSAVILNRLPDDPLTHFVIKTNFRKIKSVILMRLKVDNVRLGAIVFFSYQTNAFNPKNVETVESLRGVFSLLASRALYQLKLIHQEQLDITYSHYSINQLPEGFVLSPNSPLRALFNCLPALIKATAQSLFRASKALVNRSLPVIYSC